MTLLGTPSGLMLPTQAALRVPPHHKPPPGELSWEARMGFGVKGYPAQAYDKCEIGALSLGQLKRLLDCRVVVYQGAKSGEHLNRIGMLPDQAAENNAGGARLQNLVN